MAVSFRKFQAERLQHITTHLYKLSGTLEYERETMIWIRCHNVNPAYQTNVVVFSKCEAKFWKCCHTTMNNTHLNFFAELTEGWCNVVISMWRIRFQFGVAVWALYRCYHYNIRDVLWDELTIQRWGDVATVLKIWRHSVIFTKTSLIWRHYLKVAATLSIQHW